MSDGPSTSTIVFTDLVGSTALRVSLGEEAADRLREVHDELLSACVIDARGRVVKGGGDGLLASFDSASDALTASVAMQQAADAYGEGPDAIAPLSVRIGISTGDVSWADGDCFGLPVVEAARLEAAAQGGQILCSELVRMLARGRGGHEFESIGFLELKGLPEPVAACEVQWQPSEGVGEVELPVALTATYPTTLVGRTSEMAALVSLLDQGPGLARSAWLTGEPGIGKSRLSAEFARIAHQRGAHVLFGRCDEDLTAPFQPIIQALRWYLGNTSDDELARSLGDAPAVLARLAPEIMSRVPSLQPAPNVSPDMEQYRLFEAVRSWLAAASSRRDLIVLVDDVHWATGQTLQLLNHLIRSPEASGVLIVATSRSTEAEVSPRLDDLLDTVVAAQANHLRIDLAGLDAAEVATIVGEERAASIHAETAGNPLFVEALADAQAGQSLPRSVQAAVRRRVSRLPEPTQELLRVASVIGLVVDLPVLAAATEQTEVQVLDAIEGAVEARLFDESGAQHFRWTHALVRDTLRTELSEARRVRVHQAIGEAIETIHAADLDSQLDQLAHHFHSAVSVIGPERAFGYLVKAARSAERQLSYSEAAANYGNALELVDALPDVDAAQQAQLLLQRGRNLRLAGDLTQALTVLKNAGEVAAAVESATLLADIGVELDDTIFWTGESGAPAARVLEQALALLPEAPSRVRSMVLSSLGRCTERGGDQQRGVALVAEAQSIADELGDRPAILHALSRRVTTAWHNWDLLDDLLDASNRLISMTDESDGSAFLYGSNQHMACSAMLGDTDGMQANLERHIAAGERLGDALWIYTGVTHEIGMASMHGDLEVLETLAERQLEVGARLNWIDDSGIYGMRMFLIRREQGRLEEVAPVLRRIIQASDSPLWRPGLAALLAEIGDGSAASAEMDVLASSEYTAIARDGTRDLSFMLLADACSLLDRQDLAPRIRAELMPAERFNFLIPGSFFSLGSAARYTGMMSTTMRDFQAAENQFAEAERMNRRIEAPGWLAQTLYQRARMFVLREDLGDNDLARADLDEVITLATGTGQAKLLDRARALRSELG